LRLGRIVHCPCSGRDEVAHDREFWFSHITAWRASGLSQAEYCGRHRLAKSTLGWWSSKLKREGGAAAELVEVGRAGVKDGRHSPPIELVVGDRYLLRLYPGTSRAHIEEVLTVLEGRT
jgi:co-chaperonin GroES (HSP10)